jgi:collagen type I/II/III/V/XI/XXIV/XXVII alpha
MTTYTWLGTAAPTDWSNAADWSVDGTTPSGPPTSGDTVLIGGPTISLETSLSDVSIDFAPAASSIFAATNVELADGAVLTVGNVGGTYEVIGTGSLDGGPQPGTMQFAAPLDIELAVGASFTSTGVMFGGSLQLTTQATTAGQSFVNGANIGITGGLLVGAGVTLAGSGTIDLHGGTGAATVAGAVGAGQVFEMNESGAVANSVFIRTAAFQGILELAPGTTATFSDQAATGSYIDGDFYFADENEIRIGLIDGAEMLSQTVTDSGLTLTASAELPCFVAGTRIATPHGDVPVESLNIGDTVKLAGGGNAAVLWLGHRRVRCTRHTRPRDVWPVRVRAGAFAAHKPGRDLWLSPDHAVFIAGVLVPIRHLLNGASIAQIPLPTVAYHHVELAHHDVLLAESLPCESFLDAGNRAAFANGTAWTELYPDFCQRRHDAEGCAPRLLAGPRLAHIRRALSLRAASLSAPPASAPACGRPGR